VDYLGPTTTRCGDNKQKAWICLFTCFTTRAVHLEVVLDLSTHSFLNALTRFIARRGKPDRLLSDNGSQFVLAREILKEKSEQFKQQAQLWTEDEDIQQYLLGQGLEWLMIPQLSPWAGGLYERLVALVKGAFQRVIGRRVLPLDDLQAFVAQLEAALNQRPIAYVSDQPDAPTALRGTFFSLDPRWPSSQMTTKMSVSQGRSRACASGSRNAGRRTQPAWVRSGQDGRNSTCS